MARDLTADLSCEINNSGHEKMKTKQLLVIPLLSTIFTAACGTQNPSNNSVDLHAGMDHSKMDHGTMDHSAMKSSPNAAAADYDLQFIDTMILHHQGAVDMAKILPEKAQHSDIKKLGVVIIAAQEREIGEMKAWREKWFAGKPAAINMDLSGMNVSMAGMDMRKLGSLSGNAFDLEFIRQMIPHHEGAIAMAQEALKRSQKDEVKTLAKSIINEQQGEIDEMKRWQSEWSK